MSRARIRLYAPAHTTKHTNDWFRFAAPDQGRTTFIRTPETNVSRSRASSLFPFGRAVGDSAAGGGTSGCPGGAFGFIVWKAARSEEEPVHGAHPNRTSSSRIGRTLGTGANG